MKSSDRGRFAPCGRFDYDVCAVGGAGHVGLPLSVVFANRGLDVLIHDLNRDALAAIGRGEFPFREEDGEPQLAAALASGRLQMSSDPADVARARVVVVMIGTPVDEFLNPVLRVVRDCVDALLPYLSDDQTLVLRSTLYPGTTRWLESYLAEHGLRPKIAFCPERVAQGYAVRELQEFPQIVSGATEAAEDDAAALFELIASEVVRLSSMEAEFAKLFTNAYRYIQFAVANQFYMIAESAGVDYYRVLEGMRHNYPRAHDIPGAGFAAGPCLFKDTMQLAAFAANQFSLGHAAMMVNEGMVLHIIDRLAGEHPLEQLSVGLLGMAFKPDSDDIRSSLSYKMKKALAFRAARVLTTDPHVRDDADLLPLEAVIERSDLLVLCVPHSAYRNLDTRGKPVIDIWGFLHAAQQRLEPVAPELVTA